MADQQHDPQPTQNMRARLKERICEMADGEHDPKHHTQQMQERLQDTMDHLREDI